MNIAKFSWAEMCNNSKGKTSGSLFAGLVILLTSSFTFLWASLSVGGMLIFKFEKDINVINFFTMLVMQSIAFAAVGGSLLGIHRLSKDKPVEVEEDKKITQ
jgi:hypothetical protein